MHYRLLCTSLPLCCHEIDKMLCVLITCPFALHCCQQISLYYVVWHILSIPSATVSVGRPPHQPHPLLVITIVRCYVLVLHLWCSARVRVDPIVRRRCQPGVPLKLFLNISVESPVST